MPWFQLVECLRDDREPSRPTRRVPNSALFINPRLSLHELEEPPEVEPRLRLVKGSLVDSTVPSAA